MMNHGVLGEPEVTPFETGGDSLDLSVLREIPECLGRVDGVEHGVEHGAQKSIQTGSESDETWEIQGKMEGLSLNGFKWV
jgi:hypothetical protein